MILKKFGRYALKVLGWIAAIIVVLWIILLAYVTINEKKLINSISSVIHEQTRGEVKIEGLSVSLIRTFPVLSLQISGVRLRDSLYAVHKKDLLTASDIYLRVSLPGLISGNGALGRILVRNAEINLVTDTSGYTNEYVLKSKKPQSNTKKNPLYPDIVLNNVLITYVNPLKNKFHQANIRTIKCRITGKDDLMKIDMKMDMVVNSLGFNTDKGSYLKNKNLKGNFKVLFDRAKNDLLVENIRLDIDNHPFYFNGKFHIEKVSPDFNLTINTYNLKYDKAISVLSDTLQSRFNSYSFNKPITVTVELIGKTLYKYAPAARVIMEIDLNSANNFGSTVFDLVKGKAAINILMNGPNGRSDTLITKLDGQIDIKDAEVKYIPRNFILTNLNGSLKFLDDNLVVEKFIADAGKTRLEMNGLASSFVSVLNKEPEKLDVRWKISSPKVDLTDFRNFLSPAAAAQTKKNNGGGSISRRIDKIFSEGDIYVLFETPEMQYKTFRATKVGANVVLKKSEIVLQQVKLNHANGSMEVSGSMQNGTQSNPVVLETKMTNMDIPMLFRSFNNFGQDALTYSNLKGKLSAKVFYKTAITNKAQMITDASEGKIDFMLENGELNNFAPLLELGKKVFKKQEFDRIEFANLENTLEIKGTAFIVNPMDIRSTALNFSVEGIYDVKKGTDMSIVLPLKNLTKSQANTDLADDAKLKKGVSLRLRARTGEDKKLKISWDPFRRAVRNKESIKRDRGF